MSGVKKEKQGSLNSSNNGEKESESNNSTVTEEHLNVKVVDAVREKGANEKSKIKKKRKNPNSNFF